MLTDTKIKSLKPRDKIYKVADRDGLYVAVSPAGTVSFRYDYRINGRRETVTLGRYGDDGITLAEARDALITVKKQVNAGVSPAAAKRDGKKSISGAPRFSDYTVAYMKHVRLADSTRAMKQSVIDRDITPTLGNRLMHEITPASLRALCEKMLDRGARATALQVREIVGSVFSYAIDRGLEVTNPADNIKASSIATFEPRERALSPEEIGIFFRTLDTMTSQGSLRMAVKLMLLTLARKTELTKAKWEEVDFNNATWTVPEERMKARRKHVVYLSLQAIDIMIALKMCAGGSPYLLPGRYDMQKHISASALNKVITDTVQKAQQNGEKIEHFTVHDLRRTASTILHEEGYNSDWIEKCLAHEQKGVRAVYNKAEYAQQRREMLQDWANMIDGWVKAG
ncbi:tyrosine-type recombinase/integrase [Pectobacterium versatile]|uniref:tyrosine-type recombinase/integrase n=1 Tax=Pectobacterium versatile TaxID=2488639 RepID=UPI00102ECF41|nr:site-specific integrase [Pectobacterium versatile]TAI99840.1 site-specific integrase [Pectobacterium versatile]UEQ10497.1 tyrosine-type recombinase/integrase [Pectobacterium versatile]GKX40326.1 integrase [Pectobacterium carotovorum subsp. carotovorum]GLX46401.1 integrase [Pectobacterium carotovorum subsp. carotovorum]